MDIDKQAWLILLCWLLLYFGDNCLVHCIILNDLPLLKLVNVHLRSSDQRYFMNVNGENPRGKYDIVIMLGLHTCRSHKSINLPEPPGPV